MSLRSLAQYIPTVGGRDAEAFTINGAHFLAFANSEDADGNFLVNSTVWKLDPVSHTYSLLQTIPSAGSYDMQAFSLQVWTDAVAPSCACG